MKKIFLWMVVVFYGMLGVWSSAQAQEPVKKTQTVYVGMYVNSIVELDLKVNVYWVDFYLWFRWNGSIDPSASFEFLNAFEKWGQSIVPEAENTKTLPDGSKIKEFHIEQRFHNQFFFHAYPLDQQKLLIRIEDKTYAKDKLVYVLDPKTNYNSDIALPGWEVNGQDVKIVDHTYQTDFGDRNQKSMTYSQIEYNLILGRSPQNAYLFKLLLPIVIILLMVCMVFFIPISKFETRIEITITGLLSLIALQIVLNESLPQVGYLTLTDKIYYFAYSSILAMLIETVVVYRVSQDNPDKISWIDRGALAGILILVPLTFTLLLAMVR